MTAFFSATLLPQDPVVSGMSLETLKHVSFSYVLVSVPQVEQILVCVCAMPGYDNNPD